MQNNRLEQLLKFHQEDPDDPFILYGLALEYQKTDDQKCEKCFHELLTKFPEYLPSYYHAAKLKALQGQTDVAIDIYKRGMELARKLHDTATLRELQAAYEELIF